MLVTYPALFYYDDSDDTNSPYFVHFPDFSNLIIWTTPNKGPFIALEPWSGLSTSLEESDYLEYKKQVRLLPAGQTAELSFEIEIL